MSKKKMSMKAVRGALKSSKMPIALKKALKKKYAKELSKTTEDKKVKKKK